MVLTQFQGIKQYHDGNIVSDYLNMIPLGSSAIDRLGEELLEAGHGEPRGSFVDSLGNIYIVVGKVVYRYTYNGENITAHGRLPGRVGIAVEPMWELLSGTGQVTFCESSTKPSQVYLCDSRHVYYWNTITETSDNEWNNAFVIRMLAVPGVKLITWPTSEHGYDMYAVYMDVGSYAQMVNISEAIVVSFVTWFDNKLVLTQRDKNTVWLSATDPGQFSRFPNTKSVWDPETYSNKLWHSWYSSTNSADRLNQAIGFGGMLYMLNNATIEVWSRTGNEDAPLQPNTMSTIYHGGRDPLIVSNAMFLICKDQFGGEFIGALEGATLARISTAEIEKRFTGKILELVATTVREDTFIVARTDNKTMDMNYCYSRSGFWWCWSNPKTSEFATRSLVGNLAISNRGSILRFKNSSRTLCDGTPIMRYIRDNFVHFEGRKICRSVELVMDTGVSFLSDDPEPRENMLYCRASFDRGYSFGPVRYRRLGRGGDNAHNVTWRNLGSGGSLLLEFGLSANYQFQLYQIRLEIA